MWGWLRRRTPEPPLSGAPAVRRLKSYSGQSGYVYQYFYQGQRAVERRRRPGVEFVFSVTADRRRWFPVSVFISRAAVEAWEARCARKLSATEWYALAKMSLFRAFDESAAPEALHEEIWVREQDVAEIMQVLGLD